MSPSREIIYYTDSAIPEKMADLVRETIKSIGLPIFSSSLEPLDFGDNKVAPGPKGYLSMFQQILDCLERSRADIIYFCEADVLYHPSHFDFVPTDEKFYYNNYWWKIFPSGKAVRWDADQVSGLVCYRTPALEWYRSRVATFDLSNFDRKFEPMSGHGSVIFKSEYPNVDIRHDGNLTYSKKSMKDFRKKPEFFEESTVDEILGWELNVNDIY